MTAVGWHRSLGLGSEGEKDSGVGGRGRRWLLGPGMDFNCGSRGTDRVSKEWVGFTILISVDLRILQQRPRKDV